jgi:hypothetical protein
MTLFKLENIERLKPYDEVLLMNKDVKSFLKKAMLPKVPPERLRTELAANNVDACSFCIFAGYMVSWL